MFLGEKLNLQSTCELFGVNGVELSASVSDERLQTLYDLYRAEMTEAYRHPIATAPNKWYSAGSLTKGYLAKMGIVPPALVVDPSLGKTPNEINGLTMTSYHAGRTEARMRDLMRPRRIIRFYVRLPVVFSFIRVMGIPDR